MDAVEFVKECGRYCQTCISKTSPELVGEKCTCCMISKTLLGISNRAEQTVERIKEWSAKNPIKTRQSEFLKMFPNAVNVQDFCPHAMDVTFENSCNLASSEFCRKCKKDYWLTPINETTNKETD